MMTNSRSVQTTAAGLKIGRPRCFVVALCLAAGMLLPTAAPGATITLSTSAAQPTTGSYDQYNFTSNNTDQGAGPTDHTQQYGQSFTTPSGGPFEVTSISIKVGFVWTTPDGWNIRVSQLNNDNSLTEVFRTTTGLSVATPVNGDWLTFDVSGAPSLAADTLYGFDLYTESGAHGIWKAYGGDMYSGGGWIQTGASDPARSFGSGWSTNNINEDYFFHVGLAVIPEPATLALVGVGTLLIPLRRRC